MHVTVIPYSLHLSHCTLSIARTPLSTSLALACDDPAVHQRHMPGEPAVQLLVHAPSSNHPVDREGSAAAGRARSLRDLSSMWLTPLHCLKQSSHCKRSVLSQGMLSDGILFGGDICRCLP